MFGRKLLTKKEQKHLREMNILTKSAFERQVRFLKEEREKHPEQPYPCYDCIDIAKKLRMWDEPSILFKPEGNTIHRPIETSITFKTIKGGEN